MVTQILYYHIVMDGGDSTEGISFFREKRGGEQGWEGEQLKAGEFGDLPLTRMAANKCTLNLCARRGKSNSWPSPVAFTSLRLCRSCCYSAVAACVCCRWRPFSVQVKFQKNKGRKEARNAPAPFSESLGVGLVYIPRETQVPALCSSHSSEIVERGRLIVKISEKGVWCPL